MYASGHRPLPYYDCPIGGLSSRGLEKNDLVLTKDRSNAIRGAADGSIEGQAAIQSIGFSYLRGAERNNILTENREGKIDIRKEPSSLKPKPPRKRQLSHLKK